MRVITAVLYLDDESATAALTVQVEGHREARNESVDPVTWLAAVDALADAVGSPARTDVDALLAGVVATREERTAALKAEADASERNLAAWRQATT
jgi:hypothetical protein